MSGTWTTKDGRVLLIAWMDSAHLVNSFNMVVRTNKLSRNECITIGRNGKNQSFVAMCDEIKSRGLYVWRAGGDDQLMAADVPREDFKTMCMLRAILDTQPKNVEEIIELFHRNPVSYTEHVVSCADPKWIPVVAKFAEYRLNPVEQWR